MKQCQLKLSMQRRDGLTKWSLQPLSDGPPTEQLRCSFILCASVFQLPTALFSLLLRNCRRKQVLVLEWLRYSIYHLGVFFNRCDQLRWWRSVIALCIIWEHISIWIHSTRISFPDQIYLSPPIRGAYARNRPIPFSFWKGWATQTPATQRRAHKSHPPITHTRRFIIQKRKREVNL